MRLIEPARWLFVNVLIAVVICSVGCEPTTVLLDYDEVAAKDLRSEFEIGGGSGGGTNPLDDPNRTPQWATIKGVFKLDDLGATFQLPPLSVTKDQPTCGTSAPNPSLVLNSGMIENGLIYLNTALPANDADADEPLWIHGSYSYNNVSQEVLFDQEKCVFLSHVFAMRSDQKARIKNSDPVLHNTKIDTKSAAALNESIPASGVTFYEPKRQESKPVPVSCTVHPWMGGWMIFRDSPYFAVSDAQGTFEIANIPAGVELEYTIWHERATSLGDDKVTVKLDGNDVKVKRGRFKIPLERDQTHQLEIVVNAAALK